MKYSQAKRPDPTPHGRNKKTYDIAIPLFGCKNHAGIAGRTVHSEMAVTSAAARGA
ncbi:hypothetical protein IE4872_PC00280 (plasmid) [Rhizobium gallicum]|uniref:Uncharacterized protein n=1 Tax=Rhizobium gallicum TaxID=56730 RepID=A0A1L5NQY9_9HYPH|nr:hypothetical protein IE4872_PC00280 [Rhizobium gallicum]